MGDSPNDSQDTNRGFRGGRGGRFMRGGRGAGGRGMPPVRGGGGGGRGAGGGPRGMGGRGTGGRGTGGRGSGGRGMGRDENPHYGNPMEIIDDCLRMINPLNLPDLDMTEGKFAGRNRLYIGNLTQDVTIQNIEDLVRPFGEYKDIFVNPEKGFGFVKMATYNETEKAKEELDGFVVNGRALKVRFAPSGARLKVRNLDNFVTNELLFEAFSVFGTLEKCVVIADARGKSTGEGFVEYEKKGSALAALKHCTDGCFFLTSTMKPVIVESYEIKDDVHGLPERSLPMNLRRMGRDQGPRFAIPDTMEFAYANKWKALHEMFEKKEQNLKMEMMSDIARLEGEFMRTKYERETEMIRRQLEVRELERVEHKRRMEELQSAINARRRPRDEDMHRPPGGPMNRMMMQDNRSSRSENDNRDEPTENNGTEDAASGSASTPLKSLMDTKLFMHSYERSHHFEGRDMRDMQENMGGGSDWGNNYQRDNFQYKRRRY